MLSRAGCWLPHHLSLTGENSGKNRKTHVSPLSFGGAITIQNILTRSCFMPLNGLNGHIEMFSFTAVLYDYYGATSYINIASGRLDRGMDSGLRKLSPDVTEVYSTFVNFTKNFERFEHYSIFRF